MIIYTRSQFLLRGFAGRTYGPVAFIHSDYRDDEGLKAHEQCHIDQFWRNPLKVLLSPFVKDWLLDLEVEAYRVQKKYSPQHTQLYAEFISSRYGIDITCTEALELLKG